jgi:hypothetical protein
MRRNISNAQHLTASGRCTGQVLKSCHILEPDTAIEAENSQFYKVGRLYSLRHFMLYLVYVVNPGLYVKGRR